MKTIATILITFTLSISVVFLFSQAALAIDYAPPPGFGYFPKTGQSSGGIAGWIDPQAVMDNMIDDNPIAQRDEKFVENIEHVFSLTGSSAQVQVKSGLFRGGGSFSSLVRSGLDKRSMIYLLTANKKKTFRISNAPGTLTKEGRNMVKNIRSLLTQPTADLKAAQSAYAELTESMGETYVSEVVRRAYVGVEYRFEAKNEIELKKIQANLEFQYGSSSGNAAFNSLRTRTVKGVNYTARIIAEGATREATNAAFQEINLWDADLAQLQRLSLQTVNNATMETAPVVEYTAIPLWRAFRISSTVANSNTTNWLSIENQRDEFLKKLYKEFFYLKNVNDILRGLHRKNALVAQRPAILQELRNRQASIRQIRALAQEAMDADNQEAFDEVTLRYNEDPQIDIDYSLYLPNDRSNLLRVISFTGLVGASAEDHTKNTWSGQLYLGLEVSTDLDNFISSIALTRKMGGAIRRFTIGDYINSWRQEDPIFSTRYKEFGDNQPAAIEHYRKQFINEDNSAEYRLEIIWNDNRKTSIVLQRWEAR